MLSAKLDEIQQLLAPIAKSLNGDAEVARNVAPPRYAFIRKSFKITSPSSIGGNPRNLHDCLYRLEVRCWGKTEDEADRLWLALPTAIRQAMHGGNYTIEEGLFGPVQDSHRGFLWIVDITLRLTTPVVRLEAGAPDDERPTVTPTATEIETPPGTQGDGEIEPGD